MKMKTFGYHNCWSLFASDTTCDSTRAESAGTAQVLVGANVDVAANYELPMYTQNQFYVWRQRLSMFLGGRQYVSITLYFI